MGPGTLFSWHPTDGVGRIRLDSGEELRVGQSAFGAERPAVGAKCEVLMTAPHPLGGSRATQVKILSLPPPELPPSLAVTELYAVMERHSGGSVQVFEKWRASMPPTSDHAAWLFERVRRTTLFRGIKVELERLSESHAILSGVQPERPLYGVALDVLGPSQRTDLLALVEVQLHAWKETLTAPVDKLRLHRIGKRLGLTDLLVDDLPPLKCAPLGTVDGLDESWGRRLARWTAAATGERQIRLDAFAVFRDDERDHTVELGPPGGDALEDAALDFEIRTGGAFSRELAALLAVADGLTVDGLFLLAPPVEWEWTDDGLRLGLGSCGQGSLLLVESRRKPMTAWRVSDRGDSGEELSSFPSLGAFFDALLGT